MFIIGIIYIINNINNILFNIFLFSILFILLIKGKFFHIKFFFQFLSDDLTFKSLNAFKYPIFTYKSYILIQSNLKNEL